MEKFSTTGTQFFLSLLILLIFPLLLSSCKEEIFDLEDFTTNWSNTGDYASACPNNDAAGSWSSSLAQILHYHELAPYGAVDYNTTDGRPVSVNFDDEPLVRWSRFTNSITSTTSQRSKDEVSRYIFYTAAVLQKDFGTESYILSGHQERMEEVMRHFPVIITKYSFSANKNDSSAENLIRDELDKGNPLLLHLRNNNHTKFRLGMIVGYSVDDYSGKFSKIHIKMGYADDNEDGWYNFDKTILSFDDNSYREVYTIKPLMKTQWGQRQVDAYAEISIERVGCWSTAIGQILYYHRLAPHNYIDAAGVSNAVDYTSTNGTQTEIDFDDPAVSVYPFDSFPDYIDLGTPPASPDQTPTLANQQVAYYLYHVASIIQKDWGTGDYMLKKKDRAVYVSNYFDASSAWYEFDLTNGTELANSIALIKRELNNDRPLMVHLRGSATDPHAAVIYAYKTDAAGNLYVKINFGHGLHKYWDSLDVRRHGGAGSDNGDGFGTEDDIIDRWYQWDVGVMYKRGGGGFVTFDDLTYRGLLTIRP